MNKTIKIIDLFSGMGGMRIGFEQAAKEKGYNTVCVYSSDVKKASKMVYMENFFEIQEGDDITKVNAEELPDFDFLLAGFPCQAFSSAGKRRGFEDTRGTLFFDIARILKTKQPCGFLLENVEGLYIHDNGKTFAVIKNTLKELGYYVDFKVIDSKNLGMVQSRKRIYIIGRKDKEVFIPNVDLSDSLIKKHSLKDILEPGHRPIESDFTKKLLSHYKLNELYGKAIKDKRGGENNIHSWDFGLKGEITREQNILLNKLFKERRKKKWALEIGIDWMDGMPLTINQISSFYPIENLKTLLDDLVEKGYLKFEYPKKIVNGVRKYDESKSKGYNIVTGKLSFEFSKILSPFDYVPTLVATDIIKLGVPTPENSGIRRLTKRELLRLFGYPEEYSLNSVNINEAYDLIGNTVCVPVIKYVARNLLS